MKQQTTQKRVTTTTPDLKVLVDKQSRLLSKLSELMAAATTGSPEGLKAASAFFDKALGDTKDEPSPGATVTLDVRKQAFLDKYDIKVLEDSKVSLTLPGGASVLNLLSDAQALSGELHKQDAVYSDHLNTLFSKNPYNSTATKPLKISIDGNVVDSTYKTREEQVTFLKKQKLEMPEMEHLAAAHVAYFIATGKDLFGGNVVRARGGALGFNVIGLSVNDYFDVIRGNDVAASAALPPRN